MDSTEQMRRIVSPQMVSSLLEKLGVISDKLNKAFQRDVFQREIQRTVERFDYVKKQVEEEQRQKEEAIKAKLEAHFASKQETQDGQGLQAQEEGEGSGC